MISLFKLFLKLNGYNIGKAGKELKNIQSLSYSEFRKWQDDRKWKIARYHYENNPFYRNKVGKLFPKKWDDLPIMEKSDYQEDIEKLFSKGFTKKNTYISNTSGSSGHPFFFAKNKKAHAMDWALIKDRYNWHGLSSSSKQARFYGIPLEKWTYRKEKIKDLLMNRVRFSVFNLSDDVLQSYVEKFIKIKFKFIYGYTNSLVLFARYLLRHDILLKQKCPSLNSCIVTSEVLTTEDRDLLSKAFGVNIVNEYGASEVGLIAFESAAGEWILCEEILFIEILELDSQQADQLEGKIIVTDFDNCAMPFIRYNIGDIGLISKNLSSNDKYRKLKKLLGRENDTIILPSGKISPGLTLYYVSRSILESSGVLKEFIIRQTSLDTFVFEIVSARELNNSEIESIKEEMVKYLEPGLRLVIKRVTERKRPASGKIKHFYSEIN